MASSAPDWDALHAAISGEVILPGSSDYESARKPTIARFHGVWPQAIVLCRTPRGRFRDDLLR
ncbi:MAG: hypothetical protein M3272_04260 [Actinomycetota bacterium]|nr:hypothetical protein [Actinomycetota bacterium]